MIWRALFPLWRTFRLYWLRWLAKEMGPLHPCLPEVVREIHELENCRG